jgi:pyruvate dehydrogenase E1 component alpha subunit
VTEPLRFIGNGEDLPDEPLPAGLSFDDLIQILRHMILLRTFDERAVSLQRQGRIGTYPPFWGEEATQAGCLYAARREDWLFPSYRQSAIAILRGLPPSTVYKYRRGYGGAHGFWNPREYRVAPITISIATHLPHAVGLGWAAQKAGNDTASIVWFGDGATSEGDFHEALNFAAVWKAPTVFFCVNNQWAISTPFSKQTASADVASKAVAYGVPGIKVDGFDPAACWRATSDALERARRGEGPTLIEAFCYRLGPHGTADDPSLYRDEAVTDRWRALEPVDRTSGYLRRAGRLSDEEEASLWSEARATIATAVEELEAGDPPGSDVLFDFVYASGAPWSLEAGREELAHLERPG